MAPTILPVVPEYRMDEISAISPLPRMRPLPALITEFSIFDDVVGVGMCVFGFVPIDPLAVTDFDAAPALKAGTHPCTSAGRSLHAATLTTTPTASTMAASFRPTADFDRS